MMTQQRRVVVGCTMLPQGKKGVLQRDAEGYFLGVPLGAYNAVNSTGFLYDQNSGLNCLAPNAPLMRTALKGVLYAEYGHPVKLPGQSDGAYIQRIRKTDMDRVCAHIRNYTVIDSRDEQGRPIKLVLGDVKPFGPFGHITEQALSTPSINSYFSVRSITLDDRLQMIKYSKEVVTWDLVLEGGILQANKYNAPSLEHFNEPEHFKQVALANEVEVELTPTILWELAEQERQDQLRGIGLESNSMDFETLAKSLGWSRQQAVVQRAPAFTRW